MMRTRRAATGYDGIVTQVNVLNHSKLPALRNDIRNRWELDWIEAVAASFLAGPTIKGIFEVPTRSRCTTRKSHGEIGNS